MIVGRINGKITTDANGNLLFDRLTQAARTLLDSGERRVVVEIFDEGDIKPYEFGNMAYGELREEVEKTKQDYVQLWVQNNDLLLAHKELQEDYQIAMDVIKKYGEDTESEKESLKNDIAVYNSTNVKLKEEIKKLKEDLKKAKAKKNG